MYVCVCVCIYIYGNSADSYTKKVLVFVLKISFER